MKKICITAACALVFLSTNLQAQHNDSTLFLRKFLTPADTFNPPRFRITLATEVTLYSGFSYLLYQYWYKDYPLVPFHFFNDDGEWLQVDKVGHFFTAYFETNLTTGLYNWTGMQDKNTYWAGAFTGSILQLTVETFDGFSQKWGFSVGDFTANTIGAGLALTQNYLWHEQRIRVKFSSHFVNYSSYDQTVQQRVDDLFGTSGPEKVLKDYNGLTQWISVNPSLFMQSDTRFPHWLMFSLGYGAQGLLGGYSNAWCADPDVKPEDCPCDQLTDYSNVDRYRQYYLSLDVDLTQIPVNSPFWHMAFQILNLVKFPAPALEWNAGHGLKFYPLYF